MATEEQSKSASLIMPKTHWHERLNLLNVTVIIFLFLALLSGKSLLANNRQADIGAGIRYFVKKFFPPDFTDWPIILESLGETFQIAITSTFIAIVLSLGIPVRREISLPDGSNNTNASQYYTYASKSHLGVHLGHILRPNPNCWCIGANILQFRILRQILQRNI